MIPVAEPLIEEKEIHYVLDCLKSGWISSAGSYLDRFESEWATYCGMNFGIAVSSGTAALQIAVDLLNLVPGDEVIMPAFTIISCAQAITSRGAVPVLVDANPGNWQMNEEQIEERITERTRAIMVVHIYGHPANMDPIMDIAHRHRLTVIEDAAETHGAEYKGRRCGGFGDISIFSFYANKLITTGEGGMVLTHSPEHAGRARSLRNLCFSPARRFLHEEIGYNFRLTNIQAAIGLAQLERLDKVIERKRMIANAYSKQLVDIPCISLPVEEPWARSVYWVYGVVLNPDHGMKAGEFAEMLLNYGIETRPFFLGIHQQPVFQRMGLFENASFPVTDCLSEYGLYLPSGLTISEDQIDHVCSAIHKILG